MGPQALQPTGSSLRGTQACAHATLVSQQSIVSPQRCVWRAEGYVRLRARLCARACALVCHACMRSGAERVVRGGAGRSAALLRRRPGPKSPEGLAPSQLKCPSELKCLSTRPVASGLRPGPAVAASTLPACKQLGRTPSHRPGTLCSASRDRDTACWHVAAAADTQRAVLRRELASIGRHTHVCCMTSRWMVICYPLVN